MDLLHLLLPVEQKDVYLQNILEEKPCFYTILKGSKAMPQCTYLGHNCLKKLPLAAKQRKISTDVLAVVAPAKIASLASAKLIPKSRAAVGVKGKVGLSTVPQSGQVAAFRDFN